MVLKKFMDNEIILVGAFAEMCELANLCSKKVIGIIDNNLKGSFHKIPIIGKDDDASLLFAKYSKIPLVISPDKPQLRKKLVDYYSNIGFDFTELISPLATISRTAVIGRGTVIQSLCNVSADTNVMHDNVIGNYTTIAPNAVLLGYVKIGDCAYIGANSTILPMKEIGNNVVVGAGSVVTHNIPCDLIVKGVPAR